MKMWYVYMLLCDQKTFYLGISNNPVARLMEHKNGKSIFTKKFSDFEFVYCEQWPDKYQAAKREGQLKGWSHAKKKMLIDGKLGHNVCTDLLKSWVGSDDSP